MRTAIDTNVISALWSSEAVAGNTAVILDSAKKAGGLVVSPAVYAELLAYPRMKEKLADQFLEDTGILADFDLPRAVWIDAGRRFARYAERRRASAREGPRRLLVDFLIGAHALAQADRLMTLDPKRYERDFPELKLI